MDSVNEGIYVVGGGDYLRNKVLYMKDRIMTGFLFWPPGSEPTLRQCQETSRVLTGNRWILLVAKDEGSLLSFPPTLENLRVAVNA